MTPLRKASVDRAVDRGRGQVFTSTLIGAGLLPRCDRRLLIGGMEAFTHVNEGQVKEMISWSSINW